MVISHVGQRLFYAGPPVLRPLRGTDVVWYPNFVNVTTDQNFDSSIGRSKRSSFAGLLIFMSLAGVTVWPSTRADASPKCANCHVEEAARYATTPMGKSLVAPADLTPGTVTHEPSQSVIKIFRRGDRVIHALSEAGLEAEYPVRYQIGGKMMGSTFLVQVGDYLFESPASWFRSYGWDISPGYASARLIDFDRPINQTCLFCHAGSVRFADADDRRLKGPPSGPITCERCHGPGELHSKNPSSKNIINPAKLVRVERDSVCEQCHLEGAVRVLNPGRKWTDFHAGQPAEQTFVTYLLRGGASGEVIAVSQEEQLAQSQCAKASGGKLWCGTCHDPHGKAADRVSQIRAICESCHATATLSIAAHPRGKRNA